MTYLYRLVLLGALVSYCALAQEIDMSEGDLPLELQNLSEREVQAMRDNYWNLADAMINEMKNHLEQSCSEPTSCCPFAKKRWKPFFEEWMRAAEQIASVHLEEIERLQQYGSLWRSSFSYLSLLEDRPKACQHTKETLMKNFYILTEFTNVLLRLLQNDVINVKQERSLNLL